jgi:hypothetical protein
MNKGVAPATGEYVGLLNADDVYARPDALQIVHDRLSRSGADVLCRGIVMVRDTAPTRIVRQYGATSFKPWQLRFGHMPPHPDVFVRRDLLLEEPFRTDLRIASDYALLLKLSRRTDVHWEMIKQTLVAMRIGGLSTGGVATNARINREILSVLRATDLYASPVLIWSKYLAKVS